MNYNNIPLFDNISKEGSVKDNEIIKDEDKMNKNENNAETKLPMNNIREEEDFEVAFNNIFGNDNYQNCEEENSFASFIPENLGSKNIVPSPDDNLIIHNEEKNESFPFTKGEGVIEALGKLGLKANFFACKKKNLKKKISINSTFKITEYEEGNLKKKKKIRKYKPDNIRKKIKAKFHKEIKNLINKKLKKACSKKLFDSFPQCFITNISYELNNKYLDLTYEQLIEHDFLTKNQFKKVKDHDKEKYKINMKVLEYLKKNPEISKNSEFEMIKKMKYCDILKAYFLSKEFEQSLINLFNKKEKLNYIEDYINRALSYIYYFQNKKCKGINQNLNESDNNDNDEEENEISDYE